jgi:Glycosyl transferase family 64 domain
MMSCSPDPRNACAIVLSYKRPQNIGRIVESLLATPGIQRVIVSNNNPDVDLGDWFRARDARVEVRIQPKHEHCIKRFEIAMETKFDLFLCPDDDVFLSPQQYERLLSILRSDSQRVHGIFGEIPSFGPEGIRLGGGITGIDCEVDILNCCYAYTHAHAQRMFDLLRGAGIDDSEGAKHLDDVYLSFAGEGRPLCHDLGPFEKCTTSDLPGIATWTEPEFQRRRIDAYLRLSTLRPRGAS